MYLFWIAFYLPSIFYYLSSSSCCSWSYRCPCSSQSKYQRYMGSCNTEAVGSSSQTFIRSLLPLRFSEQPQGNSHPCLCSSAVADLLSGAIKPVLLSSSALTPTSPWRARRQTALLEHQQKQKALQWRDLWGPLQGKPSDTVWQLKYLLPLMKASGWV